MWAYREQLFIRYFPCILTAKATRKDKKKTKHRLFIRRQPEQDHERCNQAAKSSREGTGITDTSLAWDPERKAVRQKMYGQF